MHDQGLGVSESGRCLVQIADRSLDLDLWESDLRAACSIGRHLDLRARLVNRRLRQQNQCPAGGRLGQRVSSMQLRNKAEGPASTECRLIRCDMVSPSWTQSDRLCDSFQRQYSSQSPPTSSLPACVSCGPVDLYPKHSMPKVPVAVLGVVNQKWSWHSI